uniref:F-box domain-containing protein n=1 Tax=Onchocerca volvulus TaxID=6282 RepID=A0A8R1U0I1_ONCVO
MIARTWKFAEVKEILFALLLISLCFIAINGAPVTKKMKFSPKEEIDGFSETNEHLSVVMRSYPILKRLTQYFATLNNKDLLSVRGTCKSFHGLANKLLDGRNKPLIITNGTVSGTVDRQIFSSYEETGINDFLELRRWQPEIALLFDDCNNPTPRQYMPFDCLYFQIVPYDDRFDILLKFPTGGMLGNNHPRSGVIIPKMYDAFTNFIVLTNEFQYLSANESKMLHKAKFIIAFGGSVTSPSHLELDINFVIAPYLSENQSVPICYAFHINDIYEWGPSLFLVFSGSDVEASTFLVETNSGEKLREKLLKWKSELDFLESHHIIAFHFTKESTEPTNSENIFRDTFGIQPVTLRLSASELTETGLIHCNSTSNAKRNPGSAYAIVGYKKFDYITTNLL